MVLKNMKTENYWYLVQGFEFDGNEKTFTKSSDMVKYAKKVLSINKKQGLDKEVNQSDLISPINAWTYLKNVGQGLETNRGGW